MMAKKRVMGVMACPECGFPDAEVKEQKNGLLYRFCPECNAQYFPRTVEASGRLAAQMVPVTVTDAQEVEPVKGEPEREPEKNPASRARFNLGAL